MDQLRVAITSVEGVVAFAIVLVLGDYLGHKIGRWRLASYVGLGTLAIIIGFAIYAAIVLA